LLPPERYTPHLRLTWLPLKIGPGYVVEPLTNFCCTPLNQNWTNPLPSRARWKAITKVFHWRCGNGVLQTLRSKLPLAATNCTYRRPSPRVRTVIGPPPGPAPDQCSCQNDVQRP